MSLRLAFYTFALTKNYAPLISSIIVHGQVNLRNRLTFFISFEIDEVLK